MLEEGGAGKAVGDGAWGGGLGAGCVELLADATAL